MEKCLRYDYKKPQIPQILSSLSLRHKPVTLSSSTTAPSDCVDSCLQRFSCHCTDKTEAHNAMASSPKTSPTHAEDVVGSVPALGAQEWDVDKADARDATELEHNLTLRDSFRLYPKAIGFSLLFSTAIIMEGYDLSLLGSFYGYDA